MNKVVAIFNLVSISLSMVLFLISLYRSESIFIKARTRDVREILTSNIRKYEFNYRIKLAGKFIISIILFSITLSRIRIDYLFVSQVDMIEWFVLTLLFLIISAIDFKTSSPENED